MTSTRVTITWWDGSITTGASFDDAERALRAAQWSEYPSRHAFRLDMRHRAKVWSGVRPSLAKASSEDFLRALEASDLCRLDVSYDDSSTPAQDQGSETTS